MLLSYDPNDSEGGLKLLEDLTVNARPTQDQVLDEILTRNARTGYLKTYLNGRVDKGSFKTDVPVVNYEDIKPYIERLANGDSSEIISAEPITELLTRSVVVEFVPLARSKHYVCRVFVVFRGKYCLDAVGKMQLRDFRGSTEDDALDGGRLGSENIFLQPPRPRHKQVSITNFQFIVAK